MNYDDSVKIMLDETEEIITRLRHIYRMILRKQRLKCEETWRKQRRSARASIVGEKLEHLQNSTIQ